MNTSPLVNPSPIIVVESTLITLLLVIGGLALVARALGRRRPGFRFGPALIAAFVLRMGAAAVVQLTPLAGPLRGSDEGIFLAQTAALDQHSVLSSAMWNAMAKDLYLWTFSLQQRAFESPEFVLRITQVGFSVAGVAFLLAAVYDLGGVRAARYAQLFIVLEPATMFFASLIHKEPLMYLAEALAVYGCTQVWVRKRIILVWPAVLGALIAVATRSYGGWFISAGVGLCVLHASLRPGWRQRGEARLVTAALIVALVGIAPVVWHATSPSSLKKLQVSQNANATDNSNLRLEGINFSTRGQLVTNLPQRIFDVVLRPFPWQLGDASQQLGVLGELVTLATLWFLIPALWRRRGSLFDRAGPLIYVGFFTLCAYALSTGNAGTGFRYRTHFLLLGIALSCVLRTDQRAAAPAVAPERSQPLQDRATVPA